MEQQMPPVLERYGKPNKYDQAPYGTLCRCTATDGTELLFIQTSRNEEDPKWEEYNKPTEKTG